MTVEVRVRPVIDLGGGRRYVAFDGGTFAGRGLTGTVLDGGVDWQRVRVDGAIEIDAHYTLSTTGAQLIEVRSQGLRKMSDSVAQRITRGEAVDPEEYYFRTHLRFSTSAPSLGWLNDLLAVSTGRRDHATVTIDIHEVL